MSQESFTSSREEGDKLPPKVRILRQTTSHDGPDRRASIEREKTSCLAALL